MAESTKPEWQQQEENAWKKAAAEADSGRGISLLGVNVDTDMADVYAALNVTEIGPKSRLRAYIQSLQKQDRGTYTLGPPQQRMASSFESAYRKLLAGEPPFPLDALPLSREDSLWADLKGEYNLSLAELSSLKNHVSEKSLGPPQQQSAAANFNFSVSYKNKSGTTSVKSLEVDGTDMTYSSIYEKIQDLFNTDLARLSVTWNGNELTEDKLAVIQDIGPAQPIRLSVVNMQWGFSSFNAIDDALKLVGPNHKVEKDVDSFPKPHPLEGGTDAVGLACQCIEALIPLVSLTEACEATKRIYIDPILVAAARVVKDVQMEVEREVASADAKGPVDYIFKFKGRTIVCVTEGKFANIDSGVSQNLAQLTAVRSRKRKASEISADEKIYGIATTYELWQFLELDGDTVRISKHYHCDGTEQSVTDMIAMVAAVLDAGKGSD